MHLNSPLFCIGMLFLRSISSLQQSSGQRIRILTYNIQAWRDAGHVDNYDRIVEVVQDAQPDILCLNEVLYPFGAATTNDGHTTKLVNEYYARVKTGKGRGVPIPAAMIPPAADTTDKMSRSRSYMHRLARATGLKNVEYCGADPNSNFGYGCFFGNALLTHMEIENLEHCLLLPEEGDMSLGSQARDYVDPRALSAFRIKVPLTSSSCSLGMAVTHLDHKSEELRAKQIRSALNKTSGLLNDVPHVVCGDFNSMQKSDMNSKDWENVVDLYARKGWGHLPERSMVVDALVAMGYKDTFYEQQEKHRKEFPDLTAWSDDPCMRIDHLFLKQPQHADVQVQVLDHFRILSDASDHFPVALDLEIIPKDS